VYFSNNCIKFLFTDCILSVELLVYWSVMMDMDAGVRRLQIGALGEKIPNVLLVSIIIAKQTPRKVTCKSGKHLWLYFRYISNYPNGEVKFLCVCCDIYIYI
jgi:hypothetical protein